MATTAMNLSRKVDSYRLEASRKLDPQRRSALGQFMTPEPVARFMASLFGDWSGNEMRLLDAGAGVGVADCCLHCGNLSAFYPS